MENRVFKGFKIFYFLLLFFFSVFLCGFLIINASISKSEVDNTVRKVPYYSSIPQNSTVYFKIGEEEFTLSLDFAAESISFSRGSRYADYRVIADYSIPEYFVDHVGGIALEIDGEVLRYTGVQITELLLSNNITEEIKADIFVAIAKKLGNATFSKEDFLFLCNNSETDLNYSNCFLWIDYIPKLCRNYVLE